MTATPDLDATLGDIRRRIANTSPDGLNEQNTKATLIEPLLQALGWDTFNVDEVVREYRLKSRDKPVDYGLLALRTPRLFVEAKALGCNLDDHRWLHQIMGYAVVAGVEWIVLTDGDEYRIYNSHARVPADQKLLSTVRISDDKPAVRETLELLAKPRLEENRLDVLWRAHFVDRQVRASLDELFGGDNDMLIVNHVQSDAPDLSADEIRSSLRRCRYRFDFPVSPNDIIASVAKKPTRGAKRKSSSADTADIGIADLLDAGLLSPRQQLTKTYKGSELSATVLADGQVEFGGTAYNSPSQAAAAARATVIGARDNGKLPATNGWVFWRCRTTDGEVRSLGDLREACAATRPTTLKRRRVTDAG